MVREKVVWGDHEYKAEWFDPIEVAKLKNVTQVYGFLFDKDDMLCIVRPTEKRGWRLPGGGPEGNETWQETLIREADEEADIELDETSLKLIGHIKVTPKRENCEKTEHFLLRAIGRISKINEQTEDVAEKLINERTFIDPNKFLEYCPWGKIGEVSIKKALEKIK